MLKYEELKTVIPSKEEHNDEQGKCVNVNGIRKARYAFQSPKLRKRMEKDLEAPSSTDDL